MTNNYKLKDGTVIVYDEIGTGRPVIFIPGWGSKRTNAFGHILPVIGTEYRAIAIDQRGAGDSSPSKIRPVTVEMLVDDLHDFIVGMDLQDVTLVGHSMGASESMFYVRKYGCDRIRSIVLIDISPRVTRDPDDPSWDLAMLRGKHTIESALKDYDLMKRDFRAYYVQLHTASRPYVKELPEEQFNAEIEKGMSAFNVDETTDLFLSSIYVDVRDALPLITVPTAYFYADPGSLYVPEMSDYYKEHITNAPYYAVPFASETHAFPILMGDLFCERLLKFLKNDSMD